MDYGERNIDDGKNEGESKLNFHNEMVTAVKTNQKDELLTCVCTLIYTSDCVVSYVR